MKCKHCKNKAIIETKNTRFCKDHFIKYYLRTVENTIKKYKLFKKSDKVLVSVSGGKDSSALVFALYNLGYTFDGLYINLGIPNYSEKSLKVLEELFSKINTELHIINLEDFGIKIKKIKGRNPCSICGIAKRYLMNKFAYENNYDVLVTAHNLNDIVAFVLNNIYSGNVEYLLRQNIVLEKEEKFVKKVKPLYFLTEKENLVFCLVNNIPFYTGMCHFSKNTSQLKWKEKLIEVEKVLPNFQYNFARMILKLRKYIKEEKGEIRFCRICGYPTSKDRTVCSFCKLRELFVKINGNI